MSTEVKNLGVFIFIKNIRIECRKKPFDGSFSKLVVSRSLGEPVASREAKGLKGLGSHTISSEARL